MKGWIKVRELTDEHERYIRTSDIEQIAIPDEGVGSYLFTLRGSLVHVKETPEEVMEMIEETEDGDESGKFRERLLRLPMNVLFLSNKITKDLNKKGISTIRELTNTTEYALRHTKGLSNDDVDVIIASLGRWGLSLKESEILERLKLFRRHLEKRVQAAKKNRDYFSYSPSSEFGYWSGYLQAIKDDFRELRMGDRLKELLEGTADSEEEV